jgi:uncharacterized protein YbjQ (UPF0145 family)
MEQTHCTNCNTAFKAGMFGSVSALPENVNLFIKEFTKTSSEGFCTKCGNELITTSKLRMSAEKNAINREMQQLCVEMPVISIQSPKDWDYEVLDIVSGQSTTGTGIISELSSSFNDFFGTQSKTLNSKLRQGENNCKTQLRMRCLSMGGNAIVGVDIDYSEVGFEKGMLMVCMAGTAILVNNVEIFSETRQKALIRLSELQKRIYYLENFDGIAL